MKGKDNGIFREHLIGVTTGRDFWVYGFNQKATIGNVEKLSLNYNYELDRLKSEENRSQLVNLDSSFLSWGRGLRKRIDKGLEVNVDSKNIILSMYRPFTKKYLFYQDEIIENPGSFKKIKQRMGDIIYIQGPGENLTSLQLSQDIYPTST